MGVSVASMMGQSVHLREEVVLHYEGGVCWLRVKQKGEESGDVKEESMEQRLLTGC